jgi:hypothetical protein
MWNLGNPGHPLKTRGTPRHDRPPRAYGARLGHREPVSQKGERPHRKALYGRPRSLQDPMKLRPGGPG